MKKAGIVLATVLICAIIAVAGYYIIKNNAVDRLQATGSQKASPSNKEIKNTSAATEVNFVSAANEVTPAVVHIKTTYGTSVGSGGLSASIYGHSSPAMASASGVTISNDGYIVTNNHVVEDATGIEVIFPGGQSFVAKLIGIDPNTDLALLKVDAKGLPVVKMGNSDKVQVGEWVLAVGYPYSLNTTVTAGIISAKGRSIGIISRPGNESYSQDELQQGNKAIESFIQTDAAINPGNSGGALVNTDGELIGINAAIASLTGSYAGYAFAIPVNLVKKITDDLKKYGVVKRGILGVSFPAPSDEALYLKQHDINPVSVKGGVFITGIQSGSAAEAAGLKEGDIIQRIDGVQLYSSAEFSERIARHRPGDKIELTYLHKGKVETASVTLKGEGTLKNADSNPGSLKEIYDRLGATFAPLSPSLKQRFNIKAGVVVTEVRVGGFFDQAGIPEGTIIVYVNGKAINDPRDIDEALVAAQKRRIQILAIAPDGSRVAFNFSLGA